MKTVFKTTLVLAAVFALVACNGPRETESSANQPPRSTAELSDFDPYFVETIGATSPLGPTSIVRNIIQDQHGTMWMASWEGIIGYDDHVFTNYTNQDSLRRWHVFSVLEDQSGHLWFGTIGAGIYRYDGETFTNFTEKDGLSYDRQGCLFEDSSGKIWMGSEQGISIYDPTGQPTEGVSFQNLNIGGDPDNNNINSIAEDNSGLFWIASRGKAHTYDGQTFSEVLIEGDQPILNVRSIIKDSMGHIWLAGQHGFWRYDGLKMIKFSSDFVGYVYEDSKGNIWTSSSSGDMRNRCKLSRYDRPTGSSGDRMQHDPQSAPVVVLDKEDMFCGIEEDSDGGIWLGMASGACRYNGTEFNYFLDSNHDD